MSVVRRWGTASSRSGTGGCMATRPRAGEAAFVGQESHLPVPGELK